MKVSEVVLKFVVQAGKVPNVEEAEVAPVFAFHAAYGRADFKVDGVTPWMSAHF